MTDIEKLIEALKIAEERDALLNQKLKQLRHDLRWINANHKDLIKQVVDLGLIVRDMDWKMRDDTKNKDKWPCPYDLDLINKTLEERAFENVCSVCAVFGIERIEEVWKKMEPDDIRDKSLAKMLKNIKEGFEKEGQDG